jgi:hypothetical protein
MVCPEIFRATIRLKKQVLLKSGRGCASFFPDCLPGREVSLEVAVPVW